MLDAKTAAVLRDVLRRETRSFLHFVRDAYPWVTAEEQAALGKLVALIDDQQQGAAALARFLLRNHVELPYLGTYPEPFTSLSFVSLDFLLPRLIDEERRAIAALECDLAAVSDPEARAQLERILEQKRRHLPTLEGLPASHSQAAVRT